MKYLAQILGGLLVTAGCAAPQGYTISAKPGAVNYIEGHASVNGQPLRDQGLRGVFLNANDTLSTDLGKTEVLLTPGAFLRVGDNTEIRMISPSLTDTQFEVVRGEAMVEVDGLVKENHVVVIDHGASITIEKNGLYRFTADVPPSAAVLEGKAQVYFGEKKIELGKGRETILADNLERQKFDTKKEDDLYAWSNVRSEYDAAASYQSAKSLSTGGASAPLGYGFGGGYGSGWLWNSAYNGWGWVPLDGAFFSPFGWGFYGMGYLPYAPIIVAPAGGWVNGRWVGRGTNVTVPVNPNRPPAVGIVAASPAANNAARAAVAQSFASSGGFRTANGAPAAAFSGGHMTAVSSGGSAGAGHTGGWSGGSASHASGAAMSGGGGHMSSGGASRK